MTVLEASASNPLPLDAASFDAAVITFVLCSARRVPEMLAEVRRLLRPGAPLFIAGHVRAPTPATAALQRAIRPVWKRALGGCDPARDTREALAVAGFDVSTVHDVRLPLPFPVHTGIVGVAR